MLQEKINEHQADEIAFRKNRSDMMYHYIDYMMRILAKDAKSLLNITNSSDDEYTQLYEWIPKKTTLTFPLMHPSINKEIIESDFFNMEANKRYDFVTCTQVIEHIQDVEIFIKKLFEIGDQILISVPYKVEADLYSENIHGPIDVVKLTEWIGSEPDYYIIVEEPLITSPRIQYLIVYYKIQSLKPSLSEILPEDLRTNFRLKRDINVLNQNVVQLKEQMSEVVENNNFLNYKLQQFIERQFILNEIELTQKELLNKRKRNTDLTDKINEKIDEIQKLEKQVNHSILLSKKYHKEYNLILKSKSWQITRPARFILECIRELVGNYGK